MLTRVLGLCKAFHNLSNLSTEIKFGDFSFLELFDCLLSFLPLRLNLLRPVDLSFFQITKQLRHLSGPIFTPINILDGVKKFTQEICVFFFYNLPFHDCILLSPKIICRKILHTYRLYHKLNFLANFPFLSVQNVI